MINKKFEYVITTKYRKPKKVTTIITKEKKRNFKAIKRLMSIHLIEIFQWEICSVFRASFKRHY